MLMYESASIAVFSNMAAFILSSCVLIRINYAWIITVKVLCSSRKYPYSPPQKGLGFPGGGGFYKAKKFKEMYEA